MKWPFRRETRSASIADPTTGTLFGIGPTTSGQIVTADTAESLAAVYACVSTIAETIGSLPLIIYKRSDTGRERAPEHALYKLLHDAPNGIQTALEFRETLTAHMLLRGNGYAEVLFDGAGRVRELKPIHPTRVTVLKLDNGRLAYDVQDDNGRMRRLLQEEVLHLRDRSDNGLTGKSRISVARESLGLALAELEHGTRTFANGTKLAGALKLAGVMDPDAMARLRTSWGTQYAGGPNAGKVAILESGMEFQPFSMSLEDAEWIAARQMSVQEVARLFRVPPVMIGDLTHANYSNSVEMNRWFVTHSLRRHLVAWEQAISTQLLSEDGRRTYFPEHNVEGLLRGDSANRAAFYKSGIEAGWMLPSEARQLENLPAVEGIDDAKQPNRA
ncbi:phage portal protein [Dyella sp. KRB-257]|uniref:phage portal protein n=1 Tax=Dyella sp. KRB-257 TaxID=3400915 RepID=UPI003C06BCD9